MANQVMVYLNDLHEADSYKDDYTEKVQIHVVDCCGRGFTKVLESAEFVNSLNDGTIYREVKAACEDFSSASIVVRSTKLQFMLTDSLSDDEIDEVFEELNVCGW